MLNYRTSGIALALLSLFACTTVYQKPHITNDSGIAWQERQSQLSQLTKWQISGRASITQDKKAWNAGINWLENTGTYRIKMMGPFSQGGFHLDGTPEQVILTLSNGQTTISSSPEALLNKTFNLNLPISALRDWLKGLPYAGGAPYKSIEIDNHGRLKYLEQLRWKVYYQQYKLYGQQQMPSKIFMSHAGLKIRLIVDNWKYK